VSVGHLLEQAHREENRVGYLLTGMVCSKTASIRKMRAVAAGFRLAADLVERALEMLEERG